MLKGRIIETLKWETEVLVKMHKKDAWKVGKIEDKTGPCSLRVVLANGQVIRCHVDHLRRNRTAEIETPKLLDDPEAVVPDHGGSDSTEDPGLYRDSP